MRMADKVIHGTLTANAAKPATISMVGRIQRFVTFRRLNEKVGTALTVRPPTTNRKKETTQGSRKNSGAH